MGAGRKPIEQALRAKLAKYDPTTGMTGAETIATEVLALAKSGVEWAVKFVAERTEGKVREAALEAEEVHGPIRLLDFGEVAE